MSRIIFTCLVVVFFCFGIASAQEYGHRQYDRIQKAHANGVEFAELELFIITGIETSPDVNKYTTLAPVRENISRLYMLRNNAVSFTIQTASGKTYTLEMVQSHPVADNADIGYIDLEGRHRIYYEQALHYQGAIKGEVMSIATMSVFADGEVMILFSDKDGNFNLGKMKDNDSKYVLYNTKDRTAVIPFNCAVKDEDIEAGTDRTEYKGTGVIECKKVRMYWEIDSNFMASKGSLTATQNYITGLFNIMQGIYYNDGIAIELSGMYVWTVTDWYVKQSTTFLKLGHFYAYWRALNFSFPGDLSMILGMGAGGTGYGYYDGICGTAPCSISPLTGSYNNFPAYDWDVYITAHESGHNFVTMHTHSCTWQTGPGNTCGSIDNCTVQEAGASCTTCPTLYDVNNTGWLGTVMSYCGGRINFSAGFGPIVAAHLRSKVQTAPCLKNVLNPELVSKNICNGDGSVILNYKSNSYGVAPYTYLWSNSATTKDINNLGHSGTYSVIITDSNNCSITDSTIVPDYGKPGNGQALSFPMPMCCKDTSFTVTINASLPTALTPCQTVGWLRTNYAITNYAQAKTAYANAGTADILKSSNDSVVSTAVAAKLIIKSPDTCVQTNGYYYTPFVTRKAKPVTSFLVNAGNPAQVKVFQKQIGNSVVIPAQAALAGCDEYNNLSDTVAITISSYTGRANYLSIRITGDDDKQELYAKHNHAGNGTYAIPITGIKNHMQQMTIRAYDHNCKNGDTCNLATMTIQASRKVTYAVIPALTFDSSCLAGTSVFLSFGPDSCNLGINKIKKNGISRILLHPNPATGLAKIDFRADNAGIARIRVTDMLGKVMNEYPVNYNNGNNSIVLNVAAYSSGMYFVAVSDIGGSTYNMKLVIK